MVEAQVESTEVKAASSPVRLEGQLLGESLTPEGWKEIRWKNNEETIVDPLELVPLDDPIIPLHKKFRDKHREALNLFFSSVNQVKEVGRKVPLLREELMDKLKMQKQIIKDLCEFGLLKQEVIPLENGKVKMGGRAVIIPTMEARKLMRSVEQALLGVLHGVNSGLSEERKQQFEGRTGKGEVEGFSSDQVPAGVDCQKDVYQA
jgi:hypothetical protein